jgi:hypothetical protein
MKGKANIYGIVWIFICVVYAFFDSFIIKVPIIVAIPFWTLMMIIPMIIEYTRLSKENTTK